MPQQALEPHGKVLDRALFVLCGIPTSFRAASSRTVHPGACQEGCGPGGQLPPALDVSRRMPLGQTSSPKTDLPSLQAHELTVKAVSPAQATGHRGKRAGHSADGRST